MERLEALAAGYCKVPPDEEDATFHLIYQAAEKYAEGAGVPPPEDDPNPLYDLLICMLVSTWYDNRGTMVAGQTTEKLDRTAQSIILQLR